MHTVRPAHRAAREARICLLAGILAGDRHGCCLDGGWRSCREHPLASPRKTSAIWLMSACGLAATMRPMEIRVVLVTVEPPAGQVRVMPNRGQADAADDDEEIEFTGWLGLLRVLSEGAARPSGFS